MTASPDIDRARAAWLSGDASAWARYAACLRRIAEIPTAKPATLKAPAKARA